MTRTDVGAAGYIFNGPGGLTAPISVMTRDEAFAYAARELAETGAQWIDLQADGDPVARLWANGR